MKPQNENPMSTENRTKTSKPRFKIEKLEERIAPSHRVGHYHGLGYSHPGGGNPNRGSGR